MTNDIIECILYFTEKQPSIQLHEIHEKLIDTGICTQETCPSKQHICSSVGPYEMTCCLLVKKLNL